jgi:polyhydroxyalkanoate synthesis repressor PhaR
VGRIVRIIKRYKNRRLYDTQTRQAVTLGGIALLVKNDEQFRIVDNTSNKDITLAVLTNVLSDEIREWGNAAETGKLVRLLIKKGGESGVTILNKTLMAAIGAVSLTKENAEKLIDELIKRGELDKGERVEAIKEALDKAEAKSKEMAGKIRESMKSAKLGKKYAKTIDLEALNDKVDRLTTMVEEIKKTLHK